MPPIAAHRQPLVAPRTGRVTAIDNRRLSKLAKLSGAPDAKAAGVLVHVKLDDRIERGAPLCTVHAGAPGELAYALDYAAANASIFTVEDA